MDCDPCYHVIVYILSLNSSISFTIHVKNAFIHLMYFFIQTVCVIINIIIGHSPIQYTIQSLHLYASNHTHFNVYTCTYEFFIVYFILIKINLKQTTICYDSATFVQPLKWVNHIIIRTLHPFDIYIQILTIIHIIPMYLYIMNLMKIISLMYKKSSLFIVYCVNIVHLMGSIFESNCFRIVCPLVLYDIISILLLNELVLVHMTIPQEHRHTNSSFSVTPWSWNVYYPSMLFCMLVCLVSDLIILCIIHVHYFSIMNPRHPIHVHPHLYLHDLQLVCSIIDKCTIIYKINNFLGLIFTHSDNALTYICIIVCYRFSYQMSYCNSSFNEEHILLLPLLSVLTLHNTTMDNINHILYIFLFTLYYISVVPFASIFHTVTMFTNHTFYYVNVLCYYINRHPQLYPFLHTIIIIHLDILRFKDIPCIHVFICPTIHCCRGVSISFDVTCMPIPILNGTMFYIVIICYIPFLLQIIVTCKMYSPACKYFISPIIEHSLIYTAQDQNYNCIHIKILSHVIICYSYTLEFHPSQYTYLHTLITTHQSVSCFIRWNPRVRSVTCFKMFTFEVIFYFYCLSRYVVIQSHINIDMIKTTIFELHYVLCNVLLCVIYVESCNRVTGCSDG